MELTKQCWLESNANGKEIFVDKCIERITALEAQLAVYKQYAGSSIVRSDYQTADDMRAVLEACKTQLAEAHTKLAEWCALGDTVAEMVKAVNPTDKCRDYIESVRELGRLLAEAQDLVDDLVVQACGYLEPEMPQVEPTYNSMSSSTYAEAIAYLVRVGRMEYVGEPRGRCAIARRVK